MKKIICFLILSAAVIFFACKPEDPPSPIFNNVKQMSINGSYGSGLFFPDVPSDVVYLVFGLFDGEIVVSSDNHISSFNFKCGNMTTKSLSRSGVTSLNVYNYDGVSGFTSTPCTYSFSAGVSHYAIWGYNSDGTLIAGSGQYSD